MTDSPYYHASPEPLPPGFILKPKGRDFVHRDVEAVLERRRPDERRRRRDCIYLSTTEDAGRSGVDFASGFVHQATPIGPFDKRDNFWVGQLEARHDPGRAGHRRPQLDNISDDALADSYWSGVQSTNPSWEIVASGARIEKCLDEAPRSFRHFGQMADILKKIRRDYPS